MTASRPIAVAFDVVETLFSLEPVGAALEHAGAGSDDLALFFAHLLRDGFALAAAGDHREFREVAAAAVAHVVPDVTSDQRQQVLDAFSRLPAHADAALALSGLVDAGVRVVTLTNGGADQTRALLETAGLNRYVEQVLTVDDVRRWKPAPEPYLHAAHALDLPASRVALVAVHAWDVHGARRAGLVTGWASRLEGSFADIFDQPDVSGPDLVSVADALLALPSDS